MFIQVEDTPNPNVLKFIPGKEILKGDNLEYSSLESAKDVPLARRIFSIDGITNIFFGSNFISITKSKGIEWLEIKSSIFDVLIAYFTLYEHIEFKVTEDKHSNNGIEDKDSSIVKDIKELINSKVRPAVASDGGDITFESFQNGVVFVRMKGACSGCPSSSLTLKSGIENMLRYYIPEVEEVRSVNE